MINSIMGLFLLVIFFFLMLLCIALGQLIAKKKPATSGLNVTEGAVFTLMGLLVAFTFASANQRFDQRRAMITEEANAISTAYLRLDMLQPNDRLLLKKDFLTYVAARLAIYQAVPDFNAVAIELNKSKEIQKKLWQDAINASKNTNIQVAPMLILPSINNMFDVANTRSAYTYFHPHYLIFALLILVALLSAFLTGYGMAGKGTWSSMGVTGLPLQTTN